MKCVKMHVKRAALDSYQSIQSLKKGKDLKTFLDRAGLFKSFYPISPGVAVKYANLYSLKEFG
jgi:hypothetical protein